MVGYLFLVAVLVAILALPTRMPRFVRTQAARLGERWRASGVARALRRVVSRSQPWRRPPEAVPEPTPEESRDVEVMLYTLELGRLASEIEKARRVDRPGKMVHITATVAAYDTVLLTCCRTVGLAVPDRRPPLEAEERVQVELALLTRGVEW